MATQYSRDFKSRLNLWAFVGVSFTIPQDLLELDSLASYCLPTYSVNGLGLAFSQ